MRFRGACTRILLFCQQMCGESQTRLRMHHAVRPRLRLQQQNVQQRLCRRMRRYQKIPKGRMPEIKHCGIFQKNITFQPFCNMKFFKFRKFFTIILLMLLSLPASWAQGNRDFMRETGKINVVVGVILLIFLGIVWYLVRLDRKLTRLEHQLNDDKNEWTN